MAANPLTFYGHRKSRRLALLCFKYTDSQRNLLCYQRRDRLPLKQINRVKSNLARGLGPSKYNLLYLTFLINGNNKEIRGKCRSFILCLDHVVIP